MTWFDLIKMTNPFGGKWADLTRSQYDRLDKKNKYDYHSAMYSNYRNMMKQERPAKRLDQKYKRINLTVPLNLREKIRFHIRMAARIKQGAYKQPWFSIEDENDRGTYKPKLQEEITEEEYASSDKKAKINYHNRNRQSKTNSKELKLFHNRMFERIYDKVRFSQSGLPTYHSPEQEERLQ